MNYSELISSALTALRGNLLRTLLTMLGIIIGITSVILIISLGQGATESITSKISSFGTNTLVIIPGSTEQDQQGFQRNTTQTLTLEDAHALQEKEKELSLSYVSPLVTKPTNISANGQNANTTIQGVGQDYAPIQSFELSQGEFFTKESEDGVAKVVVLGSEIATNLFGEDSQAIGEIVKLDNKSFRVIGVLQPKDSNAFSNPNKAVYIPVTTAMRTILGQKYVTIILAMAANKDFIDQTVENVSSFMIEQHDIKEGQAKDFTVSSSKEALATLGSVTGLLTALLAGIAGISLLVGGIGIMNIMLVTVTERTREIGLLKAIGAREKDILAQFLIEAIVLTLVGGVIGMTLGIILSYVITTIASIPFVISLFSILLAVGVSMAIGIVFGYYPAKRAAKLSPIDALRFE